jgi:hypothetical protein
MRIAEVTGLMFRSCVVSGKSAKYHAADASAAIAKPKRIFFNTPYRMKADGD